MSLPGPARSRGPSIPEVPRITGGLLLAAGAIGFAIGAGDLARDTALALAIVAVSSIGLVVSGVLDRAARTTRVRQRSDDLHGARGFRRELLRARRRESPLVLVRLPGPGDTEPSSAERDRLAAVRRGLRRIDIAWLSRGDVFVVLPDTDADKARAVLARLRRRAPAAFSASEPYLAAFPEDGLTSAALVAITMGRRPLAPRHVRARRPTGQPGPASSSSGIAIGGELQLIDRGSSTTDSLRGSGETA